MPTDNQQPHPQDPTPQRERGIIKRTRAQGREAKGGIRERGRGAKKRKKVPKIIEARLQKEENLIEGLRRVDGRALV